MVYINSQKFACQSCIKGHRSSSCHHTDRPLFEIKKKGRPVSQCERCRELRHSKRVHSKCMCKSKAEDDHRTSSSSGTKQKRFVPIVPALPNGLKDVISNTSPIPSDLRQRVDSLLNPCHCQSVWGCKCNTSDIISDATNTPDSEGQASLATLIRAALHVENQPSTIHPAALPRSETSPVPSGSGQYPAESNKRPASRPTPASNKRHKSTHSSSPSSSAPTRSSHELPPIRFSPGPSYISRTSVPVFPTTFPGMSTLTSIAGSVCTCGIHCACPGCLEHRGPQYVSSKHGGCPQECGHCVDRRAGIALPERTYIFASNSSVQPPRTSMIDQFFLRAASLPLPPSRRSTQLDPMNTTVYPSDVLAKASERGAAFGIVNLPKLECCGGSCGCPDGRCGCGNACDGCCADHGGGLPSRAGSRRGSIHSMHTGSPASSASRSPTIAREEIPIPKTVGSCCC